MNRSGPVLMAAGVVVVLAGVGFAVVPASGPTDAGTLPAATSQASASASAIGAASASASASAPESVAPWEDPTPPSASPSQVRMETWGMVAEVDPVTVERDGRLRLPADPGRVGWWIGAARPGDPQGTVLIAGHVDTADAGRGALFRLETVPIGALVDVVANGRSFRYRVTARRSYAKSRLPGDLFQAGGPARLALVTCGGRFEDGGYESNVVVYAEPV